MDRIHSYGRKCRILRQIQSNKAKRFRQINVTQNIATVVVSSFLTFMGFSGMDKIATYLNWMVIIDKPQVEFAFNLLVFLLFLLVILHLVFRFNSRQVDAERAIVQLTSMVNEIDDLIARSEKSGFELRVEDEDSIRQRYTMLIQTIPANSDREYLVAREDYQEKQAEKTPLQLGPSDLFAEERQQAVVESLIRKSDQLIAILKTLQAVDTKLFLGGGVLRNLVWDYLHGYKSSTPIDDLDIIYFDKLSTSKEHDLDLESRLAKKMPNFKWSVKNQARMHTVNGDTPYKSLEDAVSKWPETATAIIVRLTEEEQLKLIAPFGLSDLFCLILTPTPHFVSRADRLRERIQEKEWTKRWPKLRVIAITELNNGGKTSS